MFTGCICTTTHTALVPVKVLQTHDYKIRFSSCKGLHVAIEMQLVEYSFASPIHLQLGMLIRPHLDGSVNVHNMYIPIVGVLCLSKIHDKNYMLTLHYKSNFSLSDIYILTCLAVSVSVVCYSITNISFFCHTMTYLVLWRQCFSTCMTLQTM